MTERSIRAAVRSSPRKRLLWLVVIGAPVAVAQADGSMEIYAVLDDSVAHIEHSLPTSDVHTFGFNSYNVPGEDQGSRWAIVSGAEQMSRYGLQAKETFRNGFSAFAKLEGAMNTASGQIANNGRSVLNNANDLTTISSASSINGQAFSRAEYVGVGAPLVGSIELGRTIAFSTEQVSEFDPLHASGLYSPIGYSGTIGGGLGITENGRFDNSIRYEDKLGDVSFGLQYKLGQTDSSDAADVGTAIEGMLGYRHGPLSLELAGSETRNTPALSYKLFTNDVGLRVSNTSGFMLGGKFELGSKAGIYAGVEHTDQNVPSSSNNWSTQISTYYDMPIAGLVTAKAFGSTWGAAAIRVLWAGVDYQFTPSWSVNAGYYNVNNGGNNHNDQYTIQQFAILPNYKFNERFDAYAGVMIARYSGPYLTQFLPITIASGNVLYGIGFRARLSKALPF